MNEYLTELIARDFEFGFTIAHIAENYPLSEDQVESAIREWMRKAERLIEGLP